MSRMVKERLHDAFIQRYADLDSALVVSVHGLKGTEVNELRTDLGKGEVAVHVVQNRLARRALLGTPLQPPWTAMYRPCPLVTRRRGMVCQAKELVRLTKEYPSLELKFGLIDGEAEPLTIEDISKRRSRAELQADVIQLAVSPGRRIAGCLNIGGKIAGCVKAIVEKLERGEAISKVA